MYYTKLTVRCQPDFIEILIAETGEAGFQTFMEVPDGFEAYTEERQFDDTLLSEIFNRYQAVTTIQYSFDEVEKENWNEEWEKNYDPIIVDDRCLIRADFHKIDKHYPWEIIITPKMSFGTGHHQTTYLMIKTQLDIDHKNKKVMDAGCGTAILAVMASKLGAQQVEAFDIDEWSVINGKENIEVNKCDQIRIRQGKISDLNMDGKFDIILANINKNVLLDEIGTYASFLHPGGKLLISGFYESDIPDLIQKAAQFSLKELKRDRKDNWAALLMSF